MTPLLRPLLRFATLVASRPWVTCPTSALPTRVRFSFITHLQEWWEERSKSRAPPVALSVVPVGALAGLLEEEEGQEEVQEGHPAPPPQAWEQARGPPFLAYYPTAPSTPMYHPTPLHFASPSPRQPMMGPWGAAPYYHSPARMELFPGSPGPQGLTPTRAPYPSYPSPAPYHTPSAPPAPLPAYSTSIPASPAPTPATPGLAPPAPPTAAEPDLGGVVSSSCSHKLTLGQAKAYLNSAEPSTGRMPLRPHGETA